MKQNLSRDISAQWEERIDTDYTIGIFDGGNNPQIWPLLANFYIKDRIRSAIAERIIDRHKSSVQYLKDRTISFFISILETIVELRSLLISIEPSTRRMVNSLEEIVVSTDRIDTVMEVGQ